MSVICALSRYLIDYRAQLDSSETKQAQVNQPTTTTSITTANDYAFWASMRTRKLEQLKKRRIEAHRRRTLNNDRQKNALEYEEQSDYIDFDTDDSFGLDDYFEDDETGEIAPREVVQKQKQIYFFSRTHTQIKQLVHEFNQTTITSRLSCSLLASKQWLCVHPELRGKSVFLNLSFCFATHSFFRFVFLSLNSHLSLFAFLRVGTLMNDVQLFKVNPTRPVRFSLPSSYFFNFSLSLMYYISFP